MISSTKLSSTPQVSPLPKGDNSCSKDNPVVRAMAWLGKKALILL